MANGRVLLIIDDDAELRRELAEQLCLHEQLDVRQAADGAAGLAAVAAGPVDLILLDADLPDTEGRELCRRLRRDGVRAPIVLLDPNGGDASLGRDAGADDCVTKPFRLAVLMARIRAHLRQVDRSGDATFAIGPYQFRPAAKLLVDRARNREVHLTDKETAIVDYLYRTGDRPVARATLLDEVWGYNAGVTTHTLETHIYRLRQKIEPQPEAPSILLTEAGGYRLVR